ncbi:MAG: hypothetical protein VW378_02605 [bacterium]
MKKICYLLFLGRHPIDHVQSIPFLRALRDKKETLSIHCIASSSVTDILVKNTLIDHLFEPPSTPRQYWQLMQDCRQHRYDVYVDLSVGQSLSALLGFCLQIPKRVSFQGSFSSLFFTNILPMINSHHHLDRLSLLADFFTCSLSFSLMTFQSDPVSQRQLQLDSTNYFVQGRKCCLVVLTASLLPYKNVITKLLKQLQDREFNLWIAGEGKHDWNFDSRSAYVVSLDTWDPGVLQEALSACDVFIGTETVLAQTAALQHKALLLLTLSPHYSSFVSSPISPYLRRVHLCTKRSSQALAYDLFQCFGELCYAKSQNNHSTIPQQIARSFYHHSPLLSVLSTYEDSQHFSQVSQRLESKGLQLYPFYFKAASLRCFVALFRLILSKKIVLIHGPVPFWMRALLLLFFFFIPHVPAPTFFKLPLTSHISSADLYRSHRQRLA